MDDLELATAAAQAAGEIIRAGFGRVHSTDLKGSVDPVTEIDRRAESAILDLLGTHRPDDAVLAEESGASGGSGRRWVVDPLDGTVNYLHAVPHVAVSVALWVDERPTVGVILDVTRRELFAATAEGGATANGEPMAVAGVNRAVDGIFATGFPYDRQERAEEYAAAVGRVLRVGQGVRRMGSAALDLAWVAAGRYAGYWEMRLAPWDMAAGALLVREAGGIVTRLDGGPVDLTPGPIVASNGAMHGELLRLVMPGP